MIMKCEEYVEVIRAIFIGTASSTITLTYWLQLNTLYIEFRITFSKWACGAVAEF